MSSEWKSVRLDEVASTNPEGVRSISEDQQIQYIDISALPKGGLIDSALCASYRFSDAPSRARRLVRAGDIVVSLVRPSNRNIGRVPVSLDGQIASTGTTVIRPKANHVQADFLWATLRSQELFDHLVSRETGSNYPAVKVADLHDFEFLLPPVSEQKAIAEVLGSLDERIEWCASLQNVLHQLGATALEEALASEGMTASRPLAKSKAIALGELLEALESGSRPKGGVGGIQSGIPSVGAESIERAGYFDYGKTRYVSQEFFGQMRRGHVQDFDVLVYKDGGRPGEFIPHVSLAGSGHPFGEFAINDHVYRVRVRHPYSQSVLYFWLRTPQSTEEMAMRGTGAAQPGLNQANFRDVPLPLLSEARLGALDAELSALLRLVLHLGVEQRKLSELRDSLLPKLVSGEVHIPDPQVLLEPVG